MEANQFSSLYSGQDTHKQICHWLGVIKGITNIPKGYSCATFKRKKDTKVCACLGAREKPQRVSLAPSV